MPYSIETIMSAYSDQEISKEEKDRLLASDQESTDLCNKTKLKSIIIKKENITYRQENDLPSGREHQEKHQFLSSKSHTKKFKTDKHCSYWSSGKQDVCYRFEQHKKSYQRISKGDELLRSKTRTITMQEIFQGNRMAFIKIDGHLVKITPPLKGCYRCNSPKHVYSDCSSRSTGIFCYQCGIRGVTVAECPRDRNDWFRRNPSSRKSREHPLPKKEEVNDAKKELQLTIGKSSVLTLSFLTNIN